MKITIHRTIAGVVAIGLATLTGCTNNPALMDELEKAASQVMGDGQVGALGINEIAAGLKQALTKGSETVVSQLGVEDGFNADPAIRIPLPTALVRARKVAAKVGLDGSFDTLETRLNRAAELAVPQAKSLFIDAIRGLSVEDARGILQGPDNAATTYFRDRMGPALAGQMEPIVDQSLSEVGAVRGFNQLLNSYRKIPLAPEVDADLTDHVVELGMDGVFHYLAQEEKAIREDPLKRTTELLQRVFGSP